jgi:prepilin-type N-terminal cleavage/methylation domain-containing protein
MILQRLTSPKTDVAGPSLLSKAVSLVHHNAKGFTFIELVMAMAVVGIVMAATATVLAQLFSTNRSATNHMVAVRQVQSAGYWVSHDGVMSQAILDTGDLAAPDVLRLEWTDWDNVAHDVVYSLDANLQFTRTEDGNPAVIASHIRNAVATFTDTNGNGINDKVVFTITSAVVAGSQEETRAYEVIPRILLGQ